MEPKGAISVWFFIGVSLLVNGVLVFAAGLYELVHPPAHPPVLFQLHASVWWGALLAILGAYYCIHFSPGKRAEG
jgi:succinate dehydrogenase hydrophobic anchor subunit